MDGAQAECPKDRAVQQAAGPGLPALRCCTHCLPSRGISASQVRIGFLTTIIIDDSLILTPHSLPADNFLVKKLEIYIEIFGIFCSDLG